MQNTSHAHDVLNSMQEWCDGLRAAHQQPKYNRPFGFFAAHASNTVESNLKKHVEKQLGLRDYRSLSTINIEIQDWKKWADWLFNQNTPSKFIVVERDVESYERERFEWLCMINFICTIEQIINELKIFEAILTHLFSSDTAALNNLTHTDKINAGYKLLIQLKNLDQLKQTKHTQAELKKLKKILDEFCIDQADAWPLWQAINQLTSKIIIPPGCRGRLNNFLCDFFNGHFSFYQAKMALFKNKADEALKEKQEELNRSLHGRVYENPIDALADTRLITRPTAGANITLSEQEIGNIDNQVKNKIIKKSKKEAFEKQLLRVHKHARNLHRRHQWIEKWKKNRFYRLIIALLLSSNNPDVEQKKYIVLYRVIKLVLEKDLKKDLENNPDENYLDQIRKIKSDSIDLLRQHRSRWRRARFKSAVTTSLRELDQLEKLLS